MGASGAAVVIAGQFDDANYIICKITRNDRVYPEYLMTAPYPVTGSSLRWAVE